MGHPHHLGRKVPIIYGDTPPLEGGEYIFPPLKWAIMSSFQGGQYGNQKETHNFALEKPDKCYLNQVIKVNINRDQSR